VSSPYQFDEARPDDLPRCAEMFRDLMEVHAAHPEFFAVTTNVVERKLDEYQGMIEHGTGQVFVARQSGRAVGMVVAFARRAPDYFHLRDYGYLADVFVEPEHRRRGLVRALTRRAVDYLFRCGVRSVRLTNAMDNPEAVATWEALGFHEVLSVRVCNTPPDEDGTP